MNEEFKSSLEREIKDMKEKVASEIFTEIEKWLLLREKQTKLSVYGSLSEDCIYFDIKKKFGAKLPIATDFSIKFKGNEGSGKTKSSDITFKEFFVQESRKGDGIVWIIINWFKRRK